MYTLSATKLLLYLILWRVFMNLFDKKPILYRFFNHQIHLMLANLIAIIFQNDRSEIKPLCIALSKLRGLIDSCVDGDGCTIIVLEM